MNDYYLTEGRLASLIDLPISLPEAELQADDWLILSTIQLTAGQAFTLQFLQLSLSSVVNTTANLDSLNSGPSVNGYYPFPGIPTYVTPGMGLAFLGLYANFDALTPPVNQAAQEAPVLLLNQSNILPISVARGTTPATYATPNSYSVVVCNNTSNCTLRLDVLGQLRLDLGLT